MEEKGVFLQCFKTVSQTGSSCHVLMQYLPVLSMLLLRSLLSSQTLVPTSISKPSASLRTKMDEKTTFPPRAKVKKNQLFSEPRGSLVGASNPGLGADKKVFKAMVGLMKD